jgi:hypothetical protein
MIICVHLWLTAFSRITLIINRLLLVLRVAWPVLHPNVKIQYP